MSNKEQKPYEPVVNVQDMHKALQNKFNPLAGNCSQEYKNWLDSPQCLMLAGLGIYIEVFVQTTASPSEIIEQVIASIQGVQKKIAEATK